MWCIKDLQRPKDTVEWTTQNTIFKPFLGQIFFPHFLAVLQMHYNRQQKVLIVLHLLLSERPALKLTGFLFYSKTYIHKNIIGTMAQWLLSPRSTKVTPGPYKGFLCGVCIFGRFSPSNPQHHTKTCFSLRLVTRPEYLCAPCWRLLSMNSPGIIKG